jgi:hypothetical protein
MGKELLSVLRVQNLFHSNINALGYIDSQLQQLKGQAMKKPIILLSIAAAGALVLSNPFHQAAAATVKVSAATVASVNGCMSKSIGADAVEGDSIRVAGKDVAILETCLRKAGLGGEADRLRASAVVANQKPRKTQRSKIAACLRGKGFKVKTHLSLAATAGDVPASDRPALAKAFVACHEGSVPADMAAELTSKISNITDAEIAQEKQSQAQGAASNPELASELAADDAENAATGG